ncbi:MAG: CotH kinase family protein [Flavobacteriales bacterium]
MLPNNTFSGSKIIKFFVVTTLVLSLLSSKAQVMINEYSCSNMALPDAFGNFEDWVEIYNPTGAPVDLTGYYLSDKQNNPTKWQFPGGIVPAGGHLLVICSGRDAMAGGTPHTGFRLNQTDPESIVLSNPLGNLIEQLTLNPTQAGHSRGRITDGSNNWGVFPTPSPGAANANAWNEYAAIPALSTQAGFYTGPVNISMTTTSPSSEIRYTTDGTEPTAASTLYTGPVAVNTTQVIRARTFSSIPNTPASFIETNTYFINVSHTVPVLSIAGNNLPTLLGGTQIEPVGSLEYFGSDGAFIDEAVGDFNKHGNDSWAYPQRGIDFIARDQYGYSDFINHKIFATKKRKKFKRLIIKAAASDNYPFENGGAHLRDAYVQTLSQLGNLKLDERSSTFCVLYMNGQYWGVYDVREKVDDHDFTEYYNDQPRKYKGSPEYIQFLKTWGGTWVEYGEAQALTDWNNLRAFINANNMGNPANFAIVDAQFNWESLIDYFVLNSYIVSKDWLNWNTGWWRGLNPDGDKKKWRYILWDMDACFGHYVNFTGIPDSSPNADPCNAENLPNPGGQGHTEILNKLINENDDVRQYYVTRYADLGNTLFSCDYMLQILDSMVAVIQPEMPQHIARWGGAVATWESNVQAIRNFINARCAAITQGMLDCYDLEGPYNCVIDVNPVNSGEVKLNSIWLPNYPFPATIYGGIDTKLRARGFGSYVFNYWEIPAHIINPHKDSINVKISLDQSDYIIAHFKDTTFPWIANEGFHVPSGFSPNGDGKNDFLQLFVGPDVQSFRFNVYNRWGQLIFQTTQPDRVWDGTFNGTILNPAVFAYTVELKFANGRQETRYGNITLVR